MGKLIEEVKEWNTPLVGAYLLWRFTRGFVQSHPNGDAPIVILHFIASGIMTEPNIYDAINRHRPDLASFIRWFNEEKKSDFLSCFNQKIIQKRKYTMESIDIAVSCGLLAWDTATAKIFPATIGRVKTGTSSKGIAVLKLGKKAEILGEWFSAHDLSTVTAYLGVVL
jgi:hypothetical protein